MGLQWITFVAKLRLLRVIQSQNIADMTHNRLQSHREVPLRGHEHSCAALCEVPGLSQLCLPKVLSPGSRVPAFRVPVSPPKCDRSREDAKAAPEAVGQLLSLRKGERDRKNGRTGVCWIPRRSKPGCARITQRVAP